jgi:HEPN domain-containing protein
MNRAVDWLKQAEGDMSAAEDSAATGHHEWAAFQSQQAAEKAAIALVQSLHGAVRGHSVSEILRQLAGRLAVPQELIQAALELDKVYVTSRYPNGFASGSPTDYFTEQSSRQLIRHARDIFDFCRSQIP